jgi:Holliday junction resolvase
MPRLRNPKRKGIEFERAVRKKLEERGWFVVRQACSAFPDLIAFSPGGFPVAIECKYNGYLSPEERDKLYALEDAHHITPAMARKEGKKILVVWI